MKVKVTPAGHQSGPIDGHVRQVGAVLNLPDDQARSLHDAGLVSIQKLTRIEQQRADELAQAAALEAQTAKEANLVNADTVPASDFAPAQEDVQASAQAAPDSKATTKPAKTK